MAGPNMTNKVPLQVEFISAESFNILIMSLWLPWRYSKRFDQDADYCTISVTEVILGPENDMPIINRSFPDGKIRDRQKDRYCITDTDDAWQQ
jgi:hypothetical protein